MQPIKRFTSLELGEKPKRYLETAKPVSTWARTVYDETIRPPDKITSKRILRAIDYSFQCQIQQQTSQTGPAIIKPSLSPKRNTITLLYGELNQVTHTNLKSGNY
jgi:hypothetical protein